MQQYISIILLVVLIFNLGFISSTKDKLKNEISILKSQNDSLRKIICEAKKLFNPGDDNLSEIAEKSLKESNSKSEILQAETTIDSFGVELLQIGE